jgi:hypothetical protein
MKENVYCIHLLIFFAFLIASQTAPEIRAQSGAPVDLKTGKPVEKEKTPRFVAIGHTIGFVKNTKIVSYTDTYATPDDWILRKTIFYSDSRKEIEKNFKIWISRAEKIIETGKVKKDNRKTFKRVVSLTKSGNGETYHILLYDGGKSFILIAAGDLKLAVEFEKRMSFKK